MRSAAFKAIKLAVLITCVVFGAQAQSSDQNFPTPVTTNEVAGTIRARDVGDARVTTYFYAFNGTQGDVFINVVSKNFAGDIDVFTSDGLRPLTKMVIYPDASATETGRLVYLRKPEKMLLRIEGRTPNDDAASFRIKFGGSFVALAPQKAVDGPKIESPEAIESGVRVNSVGTIVEIIPKPPKTKKVVSEIANSTTPSKEKKAEAEPVGEKAEPQPAPVKAEDAKTDDTKGETVFENAAARVTVETPPKAAAKRPPRSAARTTKTTKAPPRKTANPPVEKKPDPLASIRLVVQLKDGDVIERPMSEVSRFGVEKGILTVVLKDGTTAKYSILDVAKVTIE
jgi:hypothetical protein